MLDTTNLLERYQELLDNKTQEDFDRYVARCDYYDSLEVQTEVLPISQTPKHIDYIFLLQYYGKSKKMTNCDSTKIKLASTQIYEWRENFEKVDKDYEQAGVAV